MQSEHGLRLLRIESLLIMATSLCLGCSEPNRTVRMDDDHDQTAMDMSQTVDNMLTPSPDSSIIDMRSIADENTDASTDRTDAEVSADMALSVDGSVIDVAIPIDMESPTSIIDCEFTIKFTSPSQLSFHRLSTPPLINGRVVDSSGNAAVGIDIDLMNQADDIFANVQTNENGEFSTSAAPLHGGSGFKLIRAFIRTSNGLCRDYGQTSMYVCASAVDEDFSTLPDEWTLFRNATWEAGGWLEMTGIQMGRAGAVYNNVDVISSGLASIEFTLTTGGGINGGADGFAFTIVEVSSSNELLALLNAANQGGGLGYGVSGSHAGEDFTLRGEAVTVEIDTFYNQTPNIHTDPTPQNHIAITRNGDPGDHLVWFPVPGIEDLQPHTVRVDILDGLMRITFDGEVVIEQEVNLAFKGGYMFFSGSTGWATNYHRFDDLTILHNCR